MVKPEQPIPYALPVLEIESCIPSLEHESKIYARIIKGKDKDNNSFTIREHSGLEVEQYIGKPLECVFEIVKATFYDPESKELPSGHIKGKFIGSETGYKFFPELVTMIDGETGDADDDDFNEDDYDVLATELFSKWGTCGFGLDVYRDKPMIKSEKGVYFLNEFIFEKQIEDWEEKVLPEVPVCFVIEELLLHGIKPYEGEWKKEEKKKEEIVANHNEMIIVGRPQEIEKGRKPWWQI